MAGNSSRKGAIRQSKKGPSAGTGGNNKRRLEGKGPTPKAEDRPYHAAAKRKKAAEKKEVRSPRVAKGDRLRGEIVAGRNAVLEALRENVPSTELLVARSIDVDDRVAESLKLALHHGLPIREAHRAEVEGISPNSQGIILAIKRAATMTASAWKASSGAAARLPIAQITNLARTIDAAKKAGMFVVGLDGESEDIISTMKVATEPLMIIVGSEGKGLARLTKEKCDLVVSIPISATTESLNASVATSIALFHVDQQRRTK